MHNSLAKALERRGYTSLTPVQIACSDENLNDADLLVSAQTGSGKTVGFGLAIAPTLLGEDAKFKSAAQPLALVIAPTRELALQVKRELAWLYGEAGAVVASCVGGMDMRDERRSLDRGAHIVVATPGRLRDHITRGSIDLSDLRAVVLDEADEMLDLGFREDLEFILEEAPEDRRTLLFSATVPRSIAELAKRYQTDAQRISTVAEKSQHADIEYHAMAVAPRDVDNAIVNVLRYYEAPNAIVFCNTRAMVGRIVTRLSNRGFSVVALSGELSQNERSHALQAMRDGRARVCVATDVAARGIDLPNLDLVIHADLPNSHETLLHRSGRTGRAGRKGDSALIVPPKSRNKAQRLLKMAKLEANWRGAPSADEVRARDTERMLADSVLLNEVGPKEQAAVADLLEKFGAEQLAVAFLRSYKGNRSAPEELSVVDAKPKERAPFGPSVWFSLDCGRDDGADPRRLLPMLCRAGDISRDDIGAIRIQQGESFAEVRVDSVDGFLAKLGASMQLDDGTVLTQLDTPPAIASAPRQSFGGKPGGKFGGKPGGKFGGKSGGGGGYKGKSPRHGDGEGGERPRREKSWGDKPRGDRKDRFERPERAPRKDHPVKALGKSAEGGKPNKGPKPPVGKANSKKNRARAAEKGGNATPRRHK
ncbi:MAG: DEAD/DEAH box helicase [Cognatishimia sp.]